ncbi:hypothetical protein [Hydrogenophaga sp. RWCD_12]|uniref:hypothetical protein n=1 Tax=Hydrogenophaga sp. RWCD_12 TaxID=3391190 RepID=UPI003984FC01
MKYVALTLSLVASVLLLLAVGAIGHRIGAERRAPAPIQTSLPPLSPQDVSDQAELKTSLQALLDSAARRPAGLMAASVNPGIRPIDSFDSLFALSADSKPVAAAGPLRVAHVRAPLNAIPLPKVSVVVEGSERKAIVNGALVKVGDPVGDGLVVSAIQVGSVSFAYGKEELQVAVPLERLRVLGAFPSRVKGN